jgi:hypothetical protein
MSDLVVGGIIFGVLMTLWLLIRADNRRSAIAKTLLKTANTPQENVVLSMQPWRGKYHLEQVNGSRYGWRPLVLLILVDEIQFYPIGGETYDSIRVDEVRWFGRPQKYNRTGMNELWIYYERKEGWYLLKVKLDYESMLSVVRALKKILPETLVTAYRRRRPYIHYGPVSVEPARQDLYGLWELDAPLEFLLTPLHVVYLRGQRVLRLIPLHDIQQIKALRRVDEHDPRGLVQFQVGEEPIAFAVRYFEQVAHMLATAAKRTLEEPLQRKRKKQDEDDFDEEEEVLEVGEVLPPL